MKILQVNPSLRIKNSDNLNWAAEELKISPDTLKSGEANPKAGQLCIFTRNWSMPS